MISNGLRMKLDMLRNGYLLEAEDDNTYDIPNDDATDTNTTDVTTGDVSDKTSTTDDNTTGDVGTGDTTTYDLGDDPPTGEDNQDGGDGTPATPDTTTATADHKPIIPDKKSGEVLEIPPAARKLLVYNALRNYRDLRDRVSYKLDEVREFSCIGTVSSDITDVAVEKLKNLLTKLNDYISYVYIQTSYEINYTNYINFITEKKLCDDLVDSIFNGNNMDTV